MRLLFPFGFSTSDTFERMKKYKKKKKKKKKKLVRASTTKRRGCQGGRWVVDVGDRTSFSFLGVLGVLRVLVLPFLFLFLGPHHLAL